MYKRTADRVEHKTQQLMDFAGIRDPHIGKASRAPKAKAARSKRKSGRRY